jgi:hypothetical protein
MLGSNPIGTRNVAPDGMLTSDLYLVPRLRMNGAIPPLHLPA